MPTAGQNLLSRMFLCFQIHVHVSIEYCDIIKHNLIPYCSLVSPNRYLNHIISWSYLFIKRYLQTVTFLLRCIPCRNTLECWSNFVPVFTNPLAVYNFIDIFFQNRVWMTVYLAYRLIYTLCMLLHGCTVFWSRSIIALLILGYFRKFTGKAGSFFWIHFDLGWRCEHLYCLKKNTNIADS